MRHSDPRLTANLYTDVSHLPTFEAVQDLEWLDDYEQDEDLTCPHIGPQNAVSGGHFESQTVKMNTAEAVPVSYCESEESAMFSWSFADTEMVGETGFEPATSGSQNQRSTKLSYSPNRWARTLSTS